jgi:DNA-binding transcriptional MocR family regulator
MSLGSRFPDRVIHILSFSKSHGPDLRLAVLSSPATVRRQIQSYRSFSSGWTSRLLQETTAWLLADVNTQECLAANRRVYAERRAALVTALGARGIAIPPGDGLSIWIPVASEQFALVTLAARRIAVLPGSKCAVMPTRHIRVATAILADRHDYVAESIRLAVTGNS